MIFCRSPSIRGKVISYFQDSRVQVPRDSGSRVLPEFPRVLRSDESWNPRVPEYKTLIYSAEIGQDSSQIHSDLSWLTLNYLSAIYKGFILGEDSGKLGEYFFLLGIGLSYLVKIDRFAFVWMGPFRRIFTENVQIFYLNYPDLPWTTAALL